MNTPQLELVGSVGTLPVEEAEELYVIEEIVKKALKSFEEVGLALKRVRDKKLYRANFNSFDEYIKTRWGFELRYAQRMVKAAEITDCLRRATVGEAAPGPQIVLPPSERHARPLGELPQDQRPTAWAEAVRTAPPGKLTVKHVEQTVKRILGKQPTPHPQPFSPGEAEKVAPKREPVTIDAKEGGTREQQARQLADTAIAALQSLVEFNGSADSMAAARLGAALSTVQDFRYEHLDRMEEKQTLRLAKLGKAA